MFWECRGFLEPVQRKLLVNIVSDNLCIDFSGGVVVLLDCYIRWALVSQLCAILNYFDQELGEFRGWVVIQEL